MAPPKVAAPQLKEPEKPKSDAFDPHASMPAHKLDEAFSHASSTSGVNNLVRMLEAARSQLAAEHRVLKDESQRVVELLVQSGFSPAQLEKARAELAAIRKKMAALRKRLQHLQKRLKSALAGAGKTTDANFQKLLGAHLDRLKKLGPGVSRALLALQSVEAAYGTFADGSPALLRLEPGSGNGKALERALETLSPGAAAARASLSILRDGPEATPPSAPHLDDDTLNAEGVEGITALARALLPNGQK